MSNGGSCGDESNAQVAFDYAMVIGEATFELLKKASDFVPVPALGFAAGVALHILEMVQTVKNNKEEFKAIGRDACTIMATIIERVNLSERKLGPPISRSHLESDTKALVSDLEAILATVKKMKKRGLMKRMINIYSDVDLLQECRDRIQHSLLLFGLQSNIEIRQKLDTIEGKVAELLAAYQHSHASQPSSQQAPPMPQAHSVQASQSYILQMPQAHPSPTPQPHSPPTPQPQPQPPPVSQPYPPQAPQQYPPAPQQYIQAQQQYPQTQLQYQHVHQQYQQTQQHPQPQPQHQPPQQPHQQMQQYSQSQQQHQQVQPYNPQAQLSGLSAPQAPQSASNSPANATTRHQRRQQRRERGFNQAVATTGANSPGFAPNSNFTNIQNHMNPGRDFHYQVIHGDVNNVTRDDSFYIGGANNTINFSYASR